MAPPSYKTEQFSFLVFSSDLEKARKLAKEKKLSVSVILRDRIRFGFRLATLETSRDECARRYKEARELLQRLMAAYGRQGYEPTETMEEAADAACSWLTDEATEDEILRDAIKAGLEKE